MKFTISKKFLEKYANFFLKLKQESSGFPQNCYSDDSQVKEKMVTKFFGSYLHHKKIVRNKGLQHTIAKAIFNSPWGKFAQN